MYIVIRLVAITEARCRVPHFFSIDAKPTRPAKGRSSAVNYKAVPYLIEIIGGVLNFAIFHRNYGRLDNKHLCDFDKAGKERRIIVSVP